MNAAYKHLFNVGYRVVDGYRFKKPTPDHVVTFLEQGCINHLVHNYNFGGILCDSYADVAGEKPMDERAKIASADYEKARQAETTNAGASRERTVSEFIENKIWEHESKIRSLRALRDNMSVTMLSSGASMLTSLLGETK